MHVDVWGQLAQSDPNILEINISEAAYANLLATILASFTQVDGKVVPIDGHAFGSTDKFYEAEGGFNALLGCNVWTSRMLRSAGIRTGLWNAVPFSLTTSLHLFDGAALQNGSQG